jgi:hypothetical protein
MLNRRHTKICSNIGMQEQNYIKPQHKVHDDKTYKKKPCIAHEYLDNKYFLFHKRDTTNILAVSA